MDARLRKTPGRLELIGLASSGAQTFSLEQIGDKVTFTSTTKPSFSPTFVLQDLHRIFDAPLGPAIPDGERSGLVGKVLVKERWTGGQLRHRSYTETAATGAMPKISLAYAGVGPQRMPAHVTLKHHQLGYRLDVDCLDP